MNDYTTIASFTRPTEAAILKGKLEAEGINCILKDELTIQVYNFYSNAIGGVKLQVQKKDIPLSLEILKESGYSIEEDNPTPSDWEKYLLRIEKAPFLKRLSLGWRLVVILSIFAIIIATSLFFLTRPSTYESLTSTRWCVDLVTYEGKSYRPYSTGLRITGYNYCNESLDFNRNGKISFPGFNSPHIYGNWDIENEKLVVHRVDSFPNVYLGEYDIDISISGKNLILTSPTTSIHCYEIFH